MCKITVSFIFTDNKVSYRSFIGYFYIFLIHDNIFLDNLLSVLPTKQHSNSSSSSSSLQSPSSATTTTTTTTATAIAITTLVSPSLQTVSSVEPPPKKHKVKGYKMYDVCASIGNEDIVSNKRGLAVKLGDVIHQTELGQGYMDYVMDTKLMHRCTLYYIKWVGYKDLTWEAEENVTNVVLADYLRSIASN